jgi:hypothetical protein
MDEDGRANRKMPFRLYFRCSDFLFPRLRPIRREEFSGAKISGNIKTPPPRRSVERETDFPLF